MKKWVLLFLLLVSCERISAPPQEVPFESSKRKREDKLSLQEAAWRAKQISQLKYKLKIDLTNENFFSSIAQISFHMQKPVDLNIEFLGEFVEEIKINDNVFKPDSAKYFILLPKNLLKEGQNTVQVIYSQNYVTGGLTRFADAKTKSILILSKKGEYTAHSIWPCFDQMDITAMMELIVQTPKDWTAQWNFSKQELDYVKGSFYWLFTTPVPIAASQFSLVAGLLDTKERNIQSQKGDLLLKVLSRKEVASKIPTDEIFLALKNGVSYFEKLWFRYVLDSHTVVFVPEGIELANLQEYSSLGVTFLSEDLLKKSASMDIQLSQWITQKVMEGLATTWWGHVIRGAGDEESSVLQGMAKAFSYEAFKKNTLYSDAAEVRYATYRKQMLNLGSSSVRLKEKQILLASLLTRQWLLQLGEVKTTEKMKELLQKHVGKTINLNELSQFLQASLQESFKDIDHILFTKQNFDFKCTENPKLTLSPEVFLFRSDGPRVVLYGKGEKIQCDRLAFAWVDPYNHYPSPFSFSPKQLRSFQDGFDKLEDPELRSLAWISLLYSEISNSDLIKIIIERLKSTDSVEVVFEVAQRIPFLLAKVSLDEQKAFKLELSKKIKAEIKTADSKTKQVWTYFLSQI